MKPKIKDENRLALTEAVDSGDVETMRNLLAERPDLLTHDHGLGTWLHRAARGNSVEMIDALVELGLDVDAESKSQMPLTPLICAIYEDNVANTKRLLDHGADVNVDRPVIAAITRHKKNSLELVKLLEAHGADIHQVFPFGEGQKINALKAAMQWGKTDVVEYLKSKGAKLPDEEPQEPAEAERGAEEVIAYFKKHFGPVQELAIIEIVPTEPRITVHCIPPGQGRDCVTLFTTGMSAHPMTIPEGGEAYEYGEMYIQLPADWKYQDFQNPNHGWPVRWLRDNAQYPFQNDTWLGGPVALIANGEPPRPLAPNTKFTTLLCVADKRFDTRDGRRINLYRMMPLYTEERQMEIDNDLPTLMRALDKHDVPFVVDLNRPNVALEND